jgi:hypothetical protein
MDLYFHKPFWNNGLIYIWGSYKVMGCFEKLGQQLFRPTDLAQTSLMNIFFCAFEVFE